MAFLPVRATPEASAAPYPPFVLAARFRFAAARGRGLSAGRPSLSKPTVPASSTRDERNDLSHVSLNSRCRRRRPWCVRLNARLRWVTMRGQKSVAKSLARMSLSFDECRNGMRSSAFLFRCQLWNNHIR